MEHQQQKESEARIRLYGVIRTVLVCVYVVVLGCACVYVYSTFQQLSINREYGQSLMNPPCGGLGS